GSLRAIRRRIDTAKDVRLRPPLLYSANNRIDLLRGQQSAGALRKSRHRGSWNSFPSCTKDRGIVSNREVDRVAKADCRPTAAIRTMTSGTVLPVKEIEIHNLARWDHLRVRSGPPRRVFERSAACCGKRQRGEKKGVAFHCRSPFLRSSSTIPGASIPARMM